MNLNWELSGFVTEYYNIILHIMLYQNYIFIHIILLFKIIILVAGSCMCNTIHTNFDEKLFLYTEKCFNYLVYLSVLIISYDFCLSKNIDVM